MADDQITGGKDTAFAKRNWSNKQLKKDAAKGMEVPSTKSKKAYRKDMADQDYANDLWARKKQIPGFDRTGKTPKRYYANFDRGAARDAKKRAAKKTGSSKSR